MVFVWIHLLGALAGTAVPAPPAPPVRDICGMLERELQGRMSPFLSGRRGVFYLGGQSLAGAGSLGAGGWRVREEETIGFTHPFFRDSRARGGAIVCDEITGCGHSLWDWDFWRQTKVLYGSVEIKGADGHWTVYPNPAPVSLKWQPDRLLVIYSVAGMTITETKFFTTEDVLLNIITLADRGDTVASDAAVRVAFAGSSFVNTQPVPVGKDPSTKGIPVGTPRSMARNSTVTADAGFGARCGAAGAPGPCSAVRVFEHGTAWAKPIDCKFAPFPKGVDCTAKVGPIMYDNQTVFLAASQSIAAVLSTDDERRALYNFSVVLASGDPSTPAGLAAAEVPNGFDPTGVVVGWAHGDDAEVMRAKIQAVMTLEDAALALTARTDTINTFLSTAVPQFNVTVVDDLSASTIGTPDRAVAVAARGEATTWDVRPGNNCQNNDKASRIDFLHQTNLAGCEQACNANPACVEFNLKLTDPFWCALYSTSTTPKNSTGYTCACKGQCSSAPAPPKPRPSPSPSPPAPPVGPMRGVEDAYYYGWAIYYMMLLDSGKAPFETLGHAQSAVNNFLGIHFHDTQYYLNVGSFVAEPYHATYAHGNVLMWKNALESKMYSGGGGGYWTAHKNRGIMPDNMGSGWIASSTCPEADEHLEGAWNIYARGGNKTYLAAAYEMYAAILTPVSGNISDNIHNQKRNWGSGKSMVGLTSLSKMAKALGKDADAAAWEKVRGYYADKFRSMWGMNGEGWGSIAGGIVQQDATLVPEPLTTDRWAERMADSWLLNSEYGFYPPNSSYGAVPLASPLNHTHPGPWLAHTTKAVEVIDGLFRHNAGRAAINLTLGHLEGMQRQYGFTVYPEAWCKDGTYWGDQWYNWGSSLALVLPLQRMIGVDYTVVDGPDPARPGTLTVRDTLPASWATAAAEVPIGAAANWASVSVDRVNTTAKRVTVKGNPLGGLLIQPWLEGHRFVAAEPAGYTLDSTHGRVSWEFSGTAAAEAVVTLVWE